MNALGYVYTCVPSNEQQALTEIKQKDYSVYSQASAERKEEQDLSFAKTSLKNETKEQVETQTEVKKETKQETVFFSIYIISNRMNVLPNFNSTPNYQKNTKNYKRRLAVYENETPRLFPI